MGPYCCYNTNLKVVMVGANGRGFGWLCDLPLLSVRDRIHPGPTPPLARIFLNILADSLVSVALVTVYTSLRSSDLELYTSLVLGRLDAAVLELHTTRPTLLPSLAVMSNN